MNHVLETSQVCQIPDKQTDGQLPKWKRPGANSTKLHYFVNYLISGFLCPYGWTSFIVYLSISAYIARLDLLWHVSATGRPGDRSNPSTKATQGETSFLKSCSWLFLSHWAVHHSSRTLIFSWRLFCRLAIVYSIVYWISLFTNSGNEQDYAIYKFTQFHRSDP